MEPVHYVTVDQFDELVRLLDRRREAWQRYRGLRQYARTLAAKIALQRAHREEARAIDAQIAAIQEAPSAGA